MSCQAIGCHERIPEPILLKLSQKTLCYVIELVRSSEEVPKRLKASLDRPPEASKNGPFLQLPGDGSCSMNTQNASPSFSDVFKIFIGLRAKAVAVSKSDYTMYSMRPKLSSNLREFWQ